MFFFFNDTASTEIYTLSLHDALPIYLATQASIGIANSQVGNVPIHLVGLSALHTHTAVDVLAHVDRKSTRLNSSHANISYSVFCLKKKISTSSHISI